MFHYVKKPCGEVLAYTRKEKAEKVARLYNTQVLTTVTPEQIEQAQHMYFTGAV
jgi:hypothetical protein